MPTWRTPAQLEAEAQLKAARAKKRGQKASRSADTRRKIMAGVALLDELKVRAGDAQFVAEVRRILDAHLDREVDRSLFPDLLGASEGGLQTEEAASSGQTISRRPRRFE